jgi:hypothetical protein
MVKNDEQVEVDYVEAVAIAVVPVANIGAQ